MMRYILYTYDRTSPAGRGLRFADINGAIIEAAARIEVSSDLLHGPNGEGLQTEKDRSGVAQISIMDVASFCEKRGVTDHSGARAMLIQREDIAREADGDAFSEGNPRTPVRDFA